MPIGSKLKSRKRASNAIVMNDDAVKEEFWANATNTRGRGRPPVAVKRPTLNMRVDAEVLEAFKATGPGWQTRINALLKDAVKSGAVRS